LTYEAAVNVTATPDRIKGYTFWLTSAYSVLVGGFAGWRGNDFWIWQNVVLVVLPPVVVALIMALRRWWRNPHLSMAILGLAPLSAGAAIGGMELLLAWSIAAWTGQWPEPAARAAAGAVLTALGFGLTWAANYRRRPAGRTQ
jgi:hypothetical protein